MALYTVHCPFKLMLPPCCMCLLLVFYNCDMQTVIGGYSTNDMDLYGEFNV